MHAWLPLAPASCHHLLPVEERTLWLLARGGGLMHAACNGMLQQQASADWPKMVVVHEAPPHPLGLMPVARRTHPVLA